MVVEDDEMSKEKEINKLMALISLSFKKIYKPTNNNLRNSSNTSRANQDNSPRTNRGTVYDNQRAVNKPKRAKDVAYNKEKVLSYKREEAGIQLSVEQVDWRDDTDDEPEDQELEARYLYMAKIQKVSPDAAANSRPVFNPKPLQKDDDDLAKERDLLAYLIEKLKCKIDDSKNRVIPTTSVSRTQLKSNRLEDRVMHNNSQGKKQEVEDHRRNFKTKQPIAMPISTRKPKRTVNQSAATSLKKIVASESTNQKPRRTIRKKYEHVSKTCRCWYSKITPPEYKWKPKNSNVNVKPNVSMPLGNKSRTPNILESITVMGSTLSNTPLSSNSFAARRDNFVHRRLWVLKAHDGKSQASKVYYVEGLNHNLFSVGQFCDAGLEVDFRKSTCYVHDLNGNDLLTGSYGSDLYSITLQDTTSPNPVCLMAKATLSQAWLWHLRLSHLNFDTINLILKYDIMIGLPKLKFVKDHLCFSCELGKAKRKSFKTKTNPSSKIRLQILHMDLCGPMRVESFNGKKYMLKTDIRQKDEKRSQKRQNRARNGKA
ncbi:retrovirus-related pol polyprotein from transposon TNT 1-94 [Tanacetum coccineum]